MRDFLYPTLFTLLILVVLWFGLLSVPTFAPSPGLPNFVQANHVLINPNQIETAEYTGDCLVIVYSSSDKVVLCEADAGKVWDQLKRRGR